MNTNLYVRNISWDSTEDSLREFFSQCGTVVSAKIISDRNTGRSKGFGFVEMSSPEEAQKAIDELNEKELEGRQVFISEARPPREREDSHGGGGGGGNRRGGGGGYRGGGNDRRGGGDRRRDY